MEPSEDLKEKLNRIDELERAQRAPLPRPFGAYTLVDSLAKGGMGEVFLAKVGEVAGLQKHCVVKTLRPHLTDDREYVARFIDEARVVVQLNHKNVCQVFDVGMVGERYYLAMELVAGVDLRSVSEATGAMDPALATFITVEVLDALDYAHRKTDVSGAPLHLVHRDVSPQNIMCSFEGEVKLIDFGLAQSAVKVEKTSPQTVMGKLAYMSPEQLRGEPANPGVDLFATAIVLTELLLGERFYQGMGSQEVWTVAATGGHLPHGMSTLPAGLKEILLRALSPHPADRYPSALAFREALSAWRGATGHLADGPTLRALMLERCADAADAHKVRLMQLRQVTVQAAPVAEPSQSFALSTTNTTASGLSSPTAPSATRASSSVADDATAAVIRATLPKRRLGGLIVGGAAFLIAALGALMVFQREGGDTGAAADAGSDVAALTADAGHGDVAAVVVAEDVVDAVSDAGVVDVSTAPPAPPPPPPSPSPPPPPPPPPSTKTKAPPPSPAAPPPPPPPPSARSAGPAWDDVPPAERAGLLRRRCPDLPCVPDLVARSAGWGGLSRGEMSRFTKDLEACRKRCPSLSR